MCADESPSSDLWAGAEIIGQLATGGCRMKFGSGVEEVVDLGNEDYRWLQPRG